MDLNKLIGELISMINNDLRITAEVKDLTRVKLIDWKLID